MDYMEGIEFLDEQGVRSRRDDILRHHRIYILKISDKYQIIKMRKGEDVEQVVKDWIQGLLDLNHTMFEYGNIPDEIKAIAPRVELERIDKDFMKRLFGEE